MVIISELVIILNQTKEIQLGKDDICNNIIFYHFNLIKRGMGSNGIVSETAEEFKVSDKLSRLFVPQSYMREGKTILSLLNHPPGLPRQIESSLRNISQSLGLPELDYLNSANPLLEYLMIKPLVPETPLIHSGILVAFGCVLDSVINAYKFNSQVFVGKNNPMPKTQAESLKRLLPDPIVLYDVNPMETHSPLGYKKIFEFPNL